ncbi:MAG: hypothetical protein GTO22_07195 [Gemmatimonadales bacterium]|nr:hypothetical protein [Gemmatimonadales bacterium]
MRTFAYPLMMLLVAPICTATAQDQWPPLEPGARVRLTHQHPTCPLETCSGTKERSVGTLKAAPADTLLLELHGRVDPLAMPLSSVTKLEVQRGRKAATWTGAGIGAVAGAVVGAVIAVATFEEPAPCEWFCFDFGPSDAGEAAVMGLAGGATLGFLVGLGVGALFKTDRWEEVPLDRLRVSLAPQRDGRSALALSIAF